jgi:hypothetical protein
MADVTLTVQQIAAAGITPAYTGSLSTSNTYKVPNDGRVFLQFKKSEATDCTVTITTPATKGGLAIADRTETVAGSTGDVMAGPFPPAIYNASGVLSFTLSNIAGLTVAAFRL